MSTLAASAYFLTCCRPAKKSTFCFYVEPPKFINLNLYLQHSPIQDKIAECGFHEKLNDHSLNAPLSCTDNRAWSQDGDRRRRHFLDITNKRIPLCGIGIKEADKRNADEIQIDQDDENSQQAKDKTVPTNMPKEKEVEQQQVIPTKKEKKEVTIQIKEVLEKPIKKEEKVTPPPPQINEQEEEPPKIKELKIEEIKPIDQAEEENDVQPSPVKSFTNIDLTATNGVPQKRAETPDTPSDDIIEKLDCNLVNLEDTFDKFVKKNREFIHNLIKCLSFEKRKQKDLEKGYEILKQENEALRMKIDYQKMVNNKQLELFRKELDVGLKETKTVYKAKITEMENQLQSEQDELNYYKKRKHLHENEQVKKLKEKLKSQKAREEEILKNFACVVKCLEDTYSNLKNETSAAAVECVGDPESRNIKQVLHSALNFGMESLNLRDLSVLHDAIQKMSEQQLCHQSKLCGKNPMIRISSSQLSMISHYRADPECCCVKDQDIASLPSGQKPENKEVFYHSEIAVQCGVPADLPNCV